MTKTKLLNRSKVLSTLSNEQNLIHKRQLSEEPHTTCRKKVKFSVDIACHWKNIYKIFEKNTVNIYKSNSKNEFLIIDDRFGDRSRLIVSKSSYYWLNESIRLIQQRIEYGTTFNAGTLDEIIEIERNLKALKLNNEKHGMETTFFFRVEALVNFIRLCGTFFENPSEKFRPRLNALFSVCVDSWLHILDNILPKSIVRVQKSFIFDDDHEDFINDSMLRHYLKDDQKQILKTNHEFPNLIHVLYSIVLLVEKLEENKLVDRVYLERFTMIYGIWLQIHNEINTHHKFNDTIKLKKKSNENGIQKFTWNFLEKCHKYEKIFGPFNASHK